MRLLPAALTIALLTGGCNGQDPCRKVADEAPPAAVELMEQGYEVSKPITEDLECELQESGRWEQDT